jgi:glycosyltransferase involved in cell wall biosynthesis
MQTASYSVVHLVVGETLSSVIGPQVVDHMAVQASSPGANKPRRTAVVLIDAARRVMSRAFRDRVKELAARSPDVTVVLLPYVGRLSVRQNARILVRRIRRIVGDGRVVFHCRGEAAVNWARAFAPSFGSAGVIADIRGAWPEERLFERGADSPESADAAVREEYTQTLAAFRESMSPVREFITVSRPMISWIREVGVAGRVTYVPCCVPEISYDADVRAQTRQRLGLVNRLVFIYSGTITGYQHLEDGALRFFSEVYAQAPDAFLIVATRQPREAERLIAAVGLPAESASVMDLPQREVARLLPAADAGLLLRAPGRLNRLSQPTKLGEYLAAGVPVVVSRGTGCVDVVIDQNRAGCVIQWFGRTAPEQREEAALVIDELRRRGDAMRQSAVDLCRREFLWRSYVDQVREAYVRAAMDGAGNR